MSGTQESTGTSETAPSAPAAGSAPPAPQADPKAADQKENPNATPAGYRPASREDWLLSLPQALRDDAERFLTHSDKEFNEKVAGVLGEKLGPIPTEYREPEKFRQLLQTARSAEEWRQKAEGAAQRQTSGATPPAPKPSMEEVLSAEVDAEVKAHMAEFPIADPEASKREERRVRAEFTRAAKLAARVAGEPARNDEEAYAATFRQESGIVAADPDYQSNEDLANAVYKRISTAAMNNRRISPVAELAAEKAKRKIGKTQEPAGKGAAAPAAPAPPPAPAPKPPQGDFGEKTTGGPSDVTSAAPKSFREKVVNSKSAVEFDRSRGIRR